MPAQQSLLQKLRNAKTRTFLLILSILVIVTLSVMVYAFTREPARLSEEASTALAVPPSIQATPGNVTSEKYRELQIQANKQRAEEAAKKNGSALPTLIAFKSEIDCPAGRYNEKGECDPNGLFDKDGNKVYDEMGVLLCPSKRYNAQKKCDPNGLYDINGNLVYDEFGNLICTHNRYDSQGRCDPNGKFDKSGNPITCMEGRYNEKGECDPNGQYTKDGNLLACPHGKYNEKGECDPDGEFNRYGKRIACKAERYDAKGVCDPKGQFDKNGKPLPCDGNRYNAKGECDPNGQYDASGNLLPCKAERYNEKGECDANGKFDKNGVLLACEFNKYNEKGECDPNGKFDKNGKLFACPGEKFDEKGNCDPKGLYGPDGKLLCPAEKFDEKGNCDPKGLYGPDGKLLCPAGKFDEKGKCDPEGLYGPDGKLLCKIGRYNEKGECDPRGRYDASGKLLPGQKPETDLDRRLREQQEALAKQRAENERRAALARRQQELMAKQQEFKQKIASLAQSMQGVAGAAMNSWGSQPSQNYVAGMAAKQGTQDSTTGTENTGAATPAAGEPVMAPGTYDVVKAGSVLYSVLDTAINSDEPSPVLATIVEGKYRGAKLIGAIVIAGQGEKVIINFTKLSLPNKELSIAVEAVAMDPDTARTALAGDVDHHYMLRYGALFASSFMQGYSNAIKDQGTSTTTNLAGSTTSTKPTLGARKELFVALGSVGEKWGQAVTPLVNKPATVTVPAGIGVGVLILSDLKIQKESSNGGR